MDKLLNKLSGRAYYGLHFQSGVAEYPEFVGESGNPLRIYVDSDTAKAMDPSFRGKPVFVQHKVGISPEDFQEADGYVWKSFFNKSDGNHWAMFLVTTEKGEEAIRNGAKLSNAYFRKTQSGPGEWHSVPYDEKVESAEYEHLAIVENPRYEESIILTPDEFQKYNEDKEAELLKLANSKPKEKKKREGLMFNMFKKTKVESEESAEMKDMVVKLPSSGKELSIEELIQNADEYEKEKENKKKNKKKNEDKEPKEEGMENEDKEKMSLNDEDMGKIVKMVYEKMANMEEEKKKENKKKNDEEDEKTENEEEEDKKAENEKFSPNFIRALQNAGFEYKGEEQEPLKNEVDLTSDQLARGRERY